MGTHPIFESDFDCLTDMRYHDDHAGLGLGKVHPISFASFSNYLEVWWTILSCTIALVFYTSTYQYVRRSNKTHEFITLVVPLLWAMTSFHGLRSLPMYTLIVMMALVQVKKVGQLGEPTENAIISTFRVYILLFTMIAILAVDFNVFPTHFGKTHGYGVSVMDIGVGAFVASNALACSDAKSATVPLSVVSIVTKALPLLVVGFVRWASTAAISYHVDPTEYGIHWNFFFSLFVVRVAAPILIRTFRCMPPLLLGLVIITVYEVVLRHYGLAAIIHDRVNPRDTFFLMNKEGICSSIGLTALYCVYVQLGRHLLPMIERGNVLKRTLTLMILFWIIVFVFNLAGFVSSRRQANLGYVLWIAAMAMSFLSFCIIGDQLRCMMSITTPLLINVLNKTQLPVFLLANIFTGMTNVIMDTKAQNTLVAHIVLSLYMVSMVGVGYAIAANDTVRMILTGHFKKKQN